MAHFFCSYNLAQITGRERYAREEAGIWVVLELAGGVPSGQAVAHGSGGEAGDSESILPVLKKQCCGYRLAKSCGAELASVL